MSTSTTHRSGTRAYVGVGAAPDDPQFHVRFTPESGPSSAAPTNSFRWIGWATLHIGAQGVLVAARRRGWMGIHRRERRFFPSAEIRNVYREGGTVKVELSDGPTGPQSFLFWPGDLKTAATIVALLPTINTVEIDAPSPSEGAAPVGRRRTTLWILAVSAVAVTGLIAGGIAALRQGEQTLQAASSVAVVPAPATQSTVQQAANVAPAPDAEAFNGMQEFERVEPQIEGLKTQFATAFNALQLGSISQTDFSDGLENWLIPQWRVLSNEIGEATPVRTSVRYPLHEELVNITSTWEGALESYASGLREQDTERNLAAFAQMRHASDLERQARHLYATLGSQTSSP